MRRSTSRQIAARALRECGVGPDTLVGLCVERSNEMVVAILAILKAGGAYLPIDLAYPADRVAFMLEDAEAPVLLTQRSLIGTVPRTSARTICIEDVSSDTSADAQNLVPVAHSDHAAYVIYTSGTTGQPKGTVITHRNVVRLFAATEQWYGFDERDVWTLFHSCAFDFSVWEVWGALLFGGRVVVIPFLVSRSPEAFYELLVQERVTVLNQTPSAFRQLIQAELTVGQKPLALRYVIFGGEALEMQSLRPWFDTHGDSTPLLVNMYGITETTVHVTYRPLSSRDLSRGSVIGVPIPDVEVYILDARRQPVPLGVPGEMYVGGSGLARGYLRRPDLTEQRFVPDTVTGKPGRRLYRTGDLARFLPGREIEYLGRIDHQVKIRGFRIELGEIESVLCQDPAVREAVVIAREDVPGVKRLVAYVVSRQLVSDTSGLRDHLKAKLPDYMIPAAFVVLEKLPLTDHGKIDRKALPVPEQQRPELAARYVAPRTDVERKLGEIWSKVLRVEQVGVRDNFFELGGDSILTIQLVSLARREGLLLSPKLLFANQTIGELAAVVETVDDRTANSREAAIGDVPLTPIQRWFFEQRLDDPSYYNQAFLFTVTEPMLRAPLEQALTRLSEHHDVLRLRYANTRQEWRQRYADRDDRVPLQWFDLADVDEAATRTSIETTALAVQASLDLEKGPIWRAAYFDLGSARSGRLLLVVHHLAVDGVSWRLLVEDLETAYRQIAASEPVRLPAKSSSFKTWAECLHDYASGNSIRREREYWKRVTLAIPELADSDSRERDRTHDIEGSSRTLTVVLTAGETQSLIQQVPKAFNTHINDVLLTALARAWHQCTGNSTVYTNVEGHGREHISDRVDVSRTVGWFTSIFPVRLELPGPGREWEPGAALKSIKEQLRAVPTHGIGYGILRYLAGAAADFGSEPPMIFNYLGRFDEVVSTSRLFGFATESPGRWHSPRQRRRYALELNCAVLNARLEVWSTFNPDGQVGAAERLADAFILALRQLIEHCASAPAGGRTPSDFPMVRLDQAGVDRLVEGCHDVEDIYPLSPIQTLFHSTSPDALSTAFDQWHATFLGQLDVSAYQAAWQDTLRRHSVLRSTFHGDDLTEPLQVVHRESPARWMIEDWRSDSQEEQSRRWEEALAADRGRPLDFTQAPVMRFMLVRMTDDRWKFLWSVPALLLDGWSWPIVFRDVSHTYAALLDGKHTSLEPVRPYRDYVRWLREHSFDESARFWRAHLAGFVEPRQLLGAAPEPITSGADRYASYSVGFSTETTEAIEGVARRSHLTSSAFVHALWAILLSRHSGSREVVFGTAFAGRPSDLQGAESIVGPFVNTLPVRITIDEDARVDSLLSSVHQQLLDVNSHQFLPLMDIQRLSQVSWQHRLFDTVVVFQNYRVDATAWTLGKHVDVTDFVGPIHTNYPLMLVADPGASLRLTLMYDQQTIARTDVERWARDLSVLAEQMSRGSGRPLRELLTLLSEPAVVRRGKRRERARVDSQDFIPPQTATEKSIALVWQTLFDIERVGIEDNLFELGGHSLLIVHMHQQLRKTLDVDFPLVTLFAYPTVRSLARHLDQPSASSVQVSTDLRRRADQQKQALAQIRSRLKKEAK